ncbi:MAG: EpsI family protein [Azonexaceae bacterium]|nr:EpsI family protein [Azonexaceae bacterium]
MNLLSRNTVLLVLMLATAGLSIAMRPTQKITNDGPKVDLETMIPHAFGGWQEEKQSSALVIDPQQKQMLEKIYTQTLSRTYSNNKGQRVMLSIAYGDDQRDSLQTHYPEVCYPAQGFQVMSNEKSVLTVRQTYIPVRRIFTVLGTQRYEPVTYWTMIGDIPTLGGVDKKIAEMNYTLRGRIPDGLLFRVSSIDSETVRAFLIQDSFINALADAMTAHDRLRLMGVHE